MAASTPKTLRNKIIYEVYVRNHGKTGTFLDVMQDIERIRDLGTDILWLMPIHPIGVENKKGTLGCPYSIRDYTAINPEYGTEEDFSELIERVHESGMLLMIDVVFNHTSHDAVYTKTNPNFYYTRADGTFGNKIADWGDIIDLDYSVKDLWDVQIEVLKKWASMGVDGFRCDVAPFIPMDFWIRARKEVEAINPDFIWLAETVHPHFIEETRAKGFYCASDSQMYEAFDITYDYDTHLEFRNYLEGRINLEEYLERKRAQEYIYPENYVKLRYLENHDNRRAKDIIPNEAQLRVWTAFMFFEKGAALLYSGQEAMDSNLPDLFNIDKINWSNMNYDFVAYIKKLSSLKKRDLFAEGLYRIHKTNKKGIILASYRYKDAVVIGVFNVENKIGELILSEKDRWGNTLLKVPDGRYTNLLDGTEIVVEKNTMELKQGTAVFEFSIDSEEKT